MASIIAIGTGCGVSTDDVTQSEDQSPPNFIVILVDALRRDHVGLYGYPKPTTPFIDKLGARGVVFDDALSQAPQTLNSTASLFTSRRFPALLWGVKHGQIPGVAPERRDQWARTPRLAAADLTVAEVLASAGYETIALFNNPHHHPTSGFDQGFDAARLLDRDSGQAYARVDTVAGAFLDWHDTRDPERPFFAYLHLMDPHNPYRPPEEYRGLFQPGEGRHLYANGPPDPSFTAADLETMTALYDAEIRFVDDTLRELVDELDLRGDLERTAIIVTADHGDELLDHGGLGHGTTMELELLRIPLVFGGGPFASSAGARIGTLTRNLDLAPTLVDMAGLEIPDVYQGASLAPLLERIDAAPDSANLSYAWIGRLRSLTSTEWHCMRDLATEELTLYHRGSDPAGLTDVAEDNPELAALCIRTLDRLEAEKNGAEARARVLKDLETGGELPPESDAVREQLEALGYVDD